MATLEGDAEVLARSEEVHRLLEAVCGAEEYPWFVSDAATVYDVCSLDDAEILARLGSEFGVSIHSRELKLPIWKLADKLAACAPPGSAGDPDQRA